MSKVAVIYHEMYDGRGFSRLSRSWERYKLGMQMFGELGLLDKVQVYRPDAATDIELATVHSLQHIEHVHKMDAKGEGYFDRNDTPAWHGVFQRAALAVGGTLQAADLIASGQANQAFHVAGGLHHAHYERVSGFCIFNDIVAAIRRWQTRYGYGRIAVLDIDGHHGDGTQALLYDEPILTISLHQYDGRFFPGTGALAERGSGAGRGYNLNLPLPRYTIDAEYLPLLDIALQQIEAYEPQAIILQYGVDGHFSDRMVGIKLSTYLYEQVIQRTLALANRVCEGRLIAVGGGGYEPEMVARCWGILLANLTGQQASLGAAYQALHDPLETLPTAEPSATENIERLLQMLREML